MDKAENMNPKTKAEFFDGKSAKPRTGIVQIAGDKLVFSEEVLSGAAADTIEFPLKAIDHIKRLRNKIRIEVHDEDNFELQFIVFDQEFVKQLRKARIGEHANPFRKIQLTFRGLSTKKRILVSVASLPIALIFFFALFGQAYRFVPHSFDRAVANTAYEEFSKKNICTNKDLTSAVDKILKQLRLPEDSLDYKVTILRSKALNAFTAGGRHIYVYGKLLALSDTPESLAGVLAHEIGHAEHRHLVRRLIHRLGLLYAAGTVVGVGFEGGMLTEYTAEIATLLIGFSHSRAAEREADAHAFTRLKKLDLSPLGFRNFFQTMAKVEKEAEVKKYGIEGAPLSAKVAKSWLATHPRTESRIKYLEGKIGESNSNSSKKLLPGVDWKRIRGNCL